MKTRITSYFVALRIGCVLFLGSSVCPSGAQPAAVGKPKPRDPSPVSLARALASISTNDLLRHIQALSSDEFEGRAPASRGEELTVNYLVQQFKKLGLKPGNPDGSYLQNVPLLGFSAQPAISFDTRAGQMDFGFPNDCVVLSRRQIPEVTVQNSDVVFVGYGVVAPEYGWDDYKDVDVRGKTIVMLINDPAIPDPKDPSKLDDAMFKGRAMTYYGRWTYKYEIATARGAAAAMIVHETGPAGYPWFVVVGSNSRENFDLQASDRNLARVPIEGWITLDNARKLCAAGGHSFEALKRAAVSRDFRPTSLNSRASFSVKNTLRAVASRNVIAKLEGSDSKLKNEYVIYTAHWDHLGRNPKLEGDQIFNGAYDNASGTAGLLELAEAFTQTRPAPRRTILFLAVTAEEKGLLGAKYYAEHPLYPLPRTVANINMDGINVLGRTRDLGLVGVGQSTLEETLRSFVSAQGRVLLPEAEPEKGYFFRSDHFEFAKQGVPALYTDEGIDFIGQPKDFGKQKRAEYIERDYHKVSDEIKPGWDLSGAVEDLQLLFQTGDSVARRNEWPEWKEGSEFKARREEMLQQGR
ncbi:MAG: M28 family metallopeptidase [Verrucomicrobiales bacterium]|nr:M28 family metallopeptidase [Verrucomicrobiales bacterium]